MDNLFRRTGIDVPEPVRRFLQGETDTWLRVEEYRDGNTLVVRTDIPGIDPDKDIDITVTDGNLQDCCPAHGTRAQGSTGLPKRSAVRRIFA